MYDSTKPSLIPADAPIVAGYADGIYQWNSADWARFPNAIALSIVCTSASDQGDILDVEQGCETPMDVPGWVDRYNRVRKVPTIYVNRSNWDAVRAAVGSRRVDYWVAIPGATSIPDGAVAVQNEYPGPYDVSLCRDWWPRMTQAEFDALLAGNPVFQALAWRVGTMLLNLPTVPGGPTQGEVNALHDKLAGLGGATGSPQPVLDALAALKADLDGLTLKKA